MKPKAKPQKRYTLKPEIAAELGLSMPTVLQGIKELSAMGLVSEVGKNKSTGGRKSAALSITQMYRIAAGIDITANHISYVVIDLCGNLLIKKRINTNLQSDYRQILKNMIY